MSCGVAFDANTPHVTPAMANLQLTSVSEQLFAIGLMPSCVFVVWIPVVYTVVYMHMFPRCCLLLTVYGTCGMNWM